MKRTIEIECPDGYKPIYDDKTGYVKIIPENIMGRIKTYEDAKDYLRLVKDGTSRNESLNALIKLQTIIDVLNENHKFDLLTGTVWYPLVRFFRMKSVPIATGIIGHFRYKCEEFVLVGDKAITGSNMGLGSFFSHNGVGYADSLVGMFVCKSEEIAKYVSTQFGKLIFEACFARHLEDGEFEWLD